MSAVVQAALKKALDEKRDRLVEDIMGAAHRYREKDTLPASRRAPQYKMCDFLETVSAKLATFERESAEIDTACQRDRDADR